MANIYYLDDEGLEALWDKIRQFVADCSCNCTMLTSEQEEQVIALIQEYTSES